MTNDDLSERLRRVRKIREAIESGQAGPEAVAQHRLATEELFERIEAGKAKARAAMKQERGDQ